MAGDDADNAAADTAFGRNADAVGPLAGVVVHAAGEHDAEEVFYKLLRDSPHFCDRIDAAARECGAHDGQIAAVNEYRALLEVEFERFFDLVADHAEVDHQMADGAIAMAGQALRHEDRVVDIDVAATVLAEHC